MTLDSVVCRWLTLGFPVPGWNLGFERLHVLREIKTGIPPLLFSPLFYSQQLPPSVLTFPFITLALLILP